MTIGKLRGSLYRAARLLGDVSAVTSGRPDRIAKRLVNKFIGRKLVRRLWWR